MPKGPVKKTIKMKGGNLGSKGVDFFDKKGGKKPKKEKK